MSWLDTPTAPKAVVAVNGLEVTEAWLASETAMLVTTGIIVVERALETVDRTVERAGQFVIELAHDVMVWTNVV